MKRAMSRLLRALVTSASVAVFTVVAAQSSVPFSRTEAMIPMRDGVRLNTHIFLPERPDERLPILFLRTPYGVGNLTPAQLTAALPELTADGYVVVNQDIRGRFKSE